MLKALIIKILIALLSVGTLVTTTVVVVTKVINKNNVVENIAENVAENVVENNNVIEGTVDEIAKIIEKGGEITQNDEKETNHEHILIITSGIDATCTENGITEGKKCAECGEIIVPQNVIPASGHTYFNGICTKCGEKEPKCEHEHTQILVGYEPNCTKNGLTEGQKCTDCGQILVAQSAIPALGHTYIGNICSVCGHNRHDDCDPANIEVTPGYGATCQQTGLTDGIVCLECGEVLQTQEIIEILDHNWLHSFCTMCGKKQDLNCKHGNTLVIKGVSPTCTQSGLADGERCANCGQVVKKQATIKALGHNYVDGICTRCGALDLNVKGDKETEKIDYE